MCKIKLDRYIHRVLVRELIEARDSNGIISAPNYEYRETKVCKWKNGVATEKVKHCYMLKCSEEDFVNFINELIAEGRIEVRGDANFKILWLEVFGKNTVAAHTSNSGGFITFTIKDFLSAYKFYAC